MREHHMNELHGIGIYDIKSLLLISKVIKHQHHWGVILQHHLRQRNHELIFLTSLMGCIQGF